MHSKHASQIKAFIGLDVHKDSVSVAIAFNDGSDPVHYGKWGGSNICSERGLLKLMKKHRLTNQIEETVRKVLQHQSYRKRYPAIH